MLNLNDLGKPKSNKYKSKEEETTGEFGQAAHWIGIIMEEDDFTKFVWCDNRNKSLQSILNADKFDRQ